jgi:uncharacterized integral membrane protein
MKTKIILFMIIVVLFTIFVTQNNQPVTIYVFFWQYYVSSIILIVITGFIGILLGLILGSIVSPSKKDKDNKIIQSPENFIKE